MRLIGTWYFIILIAVVFVSAPLSFVRADGSQPAVFFSALADLPAMHGLVELEDYTLAYDKPEGRIVEMVARIEGHSIDDVRNYYSNTLPQLGWRALEQDVFLRGSEQIRFEYDEKQNDGVQDEFVRITVEPALR